MSYSLLFLSILALVIFDYRLYVQVREYWQSFEVDLVSYQNKTKLIRGWDDLFNKLKEHMNSLTAMKLSPYYKQFEEASPIRIIVGEGYIFATSVILAGWAL